MGWEVREITFKHHKDATTYDVVDQSGGLIAPDVAPSDARLIAAAPEMLEALRAAERQLRENGDNGKVYRELVAAIDKAEGRGE